MKYKWSKVQPLKTLHEVLQHHRSIQNSISAQILHGMELIRTRQGSWHNNRLIHFHIQKLFSITKPEAGIPGL